MLYWSEYKNHTPDIVGKRKKFDNTVYTFDIETSSFLTIGDRQVPASEYLTLTDDEKELSEYRSTMYIWQLSINDVVYYGRTWNELKEFLRVIDNNVPEKKIIFVHNLAFEFQFLKSVFHFKEVTARKSHKVMTALMVDYNIMFKCSYIMSNCALKYLPKLFKLPVEKQVGDLDYDIIRHCETELDDKELNYCEYDCLVVYHYIKRELETYEFVNKIPTTSTGKVRRELQNLIMTDFKYKRLVRKAINTDPHIYNLLQRAFMGGYTHANWIYADEVLKNVDSYDETSAYPYVLVTCRFPSSEFKACKVRKLEDMSKRFAYLIVVRFKNLKCRYFNTFISASKCQNIKGAKYDNGRIIEAKEIDITLTDIDFRFIIDTYDCEYEILECYFALKNYLPKQFIEFVLQKYINKTEFKGVPEKELDYQKEKNKFNALYGMSVTNTIRDNVIYKDETGEWLEEELTNEDIEDKLVAEKKKSFLSFAYGVWVTAYARDNLLRRVIELDDYVCYCDTDSCKLVQGYDKKVFEDYNKSVEDNIKFVANLLNIDVEKYQPKDIYGVKHLLGVFESETEGDSKYTYDEFITQGAKKYAVKINNKIKITVAGVPKSGASALKDLKDFKDNLVFDHSVTNKNLLIYVDNQNNFDLKDYKGKCYNVTDKTGCCIIPTTYVLGKSEEYADLLTDSSSKRAVYKE
jgi:hypothetical protein